MLGNSAVPHTDDNAIIISNVFPDDNKGGAAITQETIRWIKRMLPSKRIWIVPVEPSGNYDRHDHRFTLKEFPELEILRNPLRSNGSIWSSIKMIVASGIMLVRRKHSSLFEQIVSRAAIVVSKGGHVFVERKGLGGIFGLWVTAYPLFYAALKGRQTVVLCASVGPFDSIASRIVNGLILKRVSVVVTRDPLSTHEAKKLGCKRVVEYPDIVFMYNRNRAVAGVSGMCGPKVNYGAFVVSAGPTPEDDRVFVEHLRQLALSILEEGIVDKCVVVIQSLQDIKISRAFVSDIDDRLVLLENDFSPDELLGVYKHARFMIGKRLHAGIFALLMGTPVFLFRHDGTKVDGVMSKIRMNRVFRYPDFAVESVLEQIRDVNSSEHARRAAKEEIEDIVSNAERDLRGLDSLMAHYIRTGHLRGSTEG